MINETMTFKKVYGILQKHAETLRNQTEPNIDDLLSIVEESMSAYRVCKDRIDAVEKALEKALTDVVSDSPPRGGVDEDTFGLSASAGSIARTTRPATSRAATGGSDEIDNDIPF